jgi:excinuclease UvrABC ATPase subunit
LTFYTQKIKWLLREAVQIIAGFDTIYNEGQRQLYGKPSAHARLFMRYGRVGRRYITGLCHPLFQSNKKTTNKNPMLAP